MAKVNTPVDYDKAKYPNKSGKSVPEFKPGTKPNPTKRSKS